MAPPIPSRSAPISHRPEPLDFGYSWLWTYGHLIPAAVFAAIAVRAGSSGVSVPGWASAAAWALAVWALAGFVVMRFVVRMNELGEVGRDDFAPGVSRVLDLGCGAGRTSITVALARPLARVVALDDFSADYIEGHSEANTLANLRAAGVDDRVEIRSADMCALPFPDDSFDAVVSSAAIDHLDRAAIPVALAEANRVLRADGQLMLWLIVPNWLVFVAYGPLLYFHNATRGQWRAMLRDSGFRLNAEGTARGLAWMLATRVRAPERAGDRVPTRTRAVPRHALVLSGGLIGGGVALRLLGLDAPGLWLAGVGVVAIHLGAAFLGLATLRGWLVARREKT